MRSQVIQIDSLAPDFELPGIDGRRHGLSVLRGRPVALLFYRGHWCASCRRQLGQWRDRYGEFRDLGAEVIAVSAEPLAVATAEAAATGLPFRILSDGDLAAIVRYGVLHDDEPEGRRIARPAVFLIDGAGRLRYAYVGEDAADRPAVGVVLLALETIA